MTQRPLISFTLLAFALSWLSWLAASLTASRVLFFVGGLGPAIAAAVVAWRLGSLQPWLARVLRWRVRLRFYAFALGLPVVLYTVPNVVLALLGQEPEWSVLPSRVPAYLVTWTAAVFMGGLEEPGWRGFALPRLQERLSPVTATLLLGVVWGLWHLPVQPAAVIVTVPLAFLYTWLLNRTGSALLCIMLHASLTPAQDHLSVLADSLLVDLTILGTLVVAAVGLVVVTRGRLGRSEHRDSDVGPLPDPVSA